jgi:hypothetical protein
MDIPWHSWLILSSESSKYFLFCLIWNYKTTRDIRKKKSRAGRAAGSTQPGYSLAQLARIGFRVLQKSVVAGNIYIEDFQLISQPSFFFSNTS